MNSQPNSNMNKSFYHFLNFLINANNKEIMSCLAKPVQQVKSPSSKSICKKDKIANHIWKGAVISILNKGHAMSPLEKQTLLFLLEITKDPQSFFPNAQGKDIIKFKNDESKCYFIGKCKNSIYPWLKNVIFEKIVNLNKESADLIAGLWLKGK